MTAAVRVDRLTKRFGSTLAVDDLSFDVVPGRVTGFLGPNGSGKTTTLRCLLGLVTPTGGKATFDGRRYDELDHPGRTVGAALEASGFHPGRSATDHLRVIALAAGIPRSRVAEVLSLVGLADAGDRRVEAFSLGMRQRLALASALLGDPGILVLDEPANGLDPEGIAWLRSLLRYLADEGRTVLVSSHLLAEVEQTVDDVVLISRGRLVRACSLEALVAESHGGVRVRTPDRDRLAAALSDGVDGAVPRAVTHGADHDLVFVEGLTPAQVGRVALRAGVELHELRDEAGDLEQVFLDLTRSDAPGSGAMGGVA